MSTASLRIAQALEDRLTAEWQPVVDLAAAIHGVEQASESQVEMTRVAARRLHHQHRALVQRRRILRQVGQVEEERFVLMVRRATRADWPPAGLKGQAPTKSDHPFSTYGLPRTTDRGTQ